MYVCSFTLKTKKKLKKTGGKQRQLTNANQAGRQAGRERERRDEATARERGGGERGMMNIMLVGCEARVTTTRPDKDTTSEARKDRRDSGGAGWGGGDKEGEIYRENRRFQPFEKQANKRRIMETQIFHLAKL
jgi:hypothetical protein